MYIMISETFIEIDLTAWNFKTNRQSYEPVINPRYNIHCFDNTYIHDWYISVWVLSMFYIQKIR